MNDDSFAAALRTELDAVVARYEALVRAVAAISASSASSARAAKVEGEIEALRAEAARLAADNQRVRAEAADYKVEAQGLHARVDALQRALDDAHARAAKLEGEAHAALEATLSYEEQFTAEKRFVEACRDLGGSLLGEALAVAAGKALEPGSAAYAALKARGVEAALVAAVKDRGRNVASMPLLERERAALGALATIAGCELVAPSAGTRFSGATMEKSSQVSDPAEEGNVVGCALPGLRRAGTDGALVFPRVVVATG